MNEMSLLALGIAPTKPMQQRDRLLSSTVTMLLGREPAHEITANMRLGDRADSRSLLAQPHPCASAILGNEFDAGGFERGADGRYRRWVGLGLIVLKSGDRRNADFGFPG